MALYLTEQDVEQLLSMEEAIEAVEGAFGRQALGEVTLQPRRRLFVPQGTYHTMSASDLGLNMFGTKAYTSFAPRTRFLVMLYCAHNGDLLAMIEADNLGRIRTGAASGVAARCMAANEPNMRVGIYGTGWQAETQLEAVCAVRSVGHVAVWSRDPQHRADFCRRMSAKLQCEAAPAAKPEEAAEGRQIVITATSAVSPVLHGEWLSQGVHINAVGSNLLMKRELDGDAVGRADLVAVESIEQARQEAGDLLPPYESRRLRWEDVVELSHIVGGRHPGRTDNRQITLFKSVGVALEDIAVGAVVYHKAVEQKMGRNMPMWEG